MAHLLAPGATQASVAAELGVTPTQLKTWWLEREWDIERTLETNASILAFAGIALGATVYKRWLALPALVTAFLFQHAVQGWCPPVPLLRRLGFRTVSEIEQERYALKALRGDFVRVDQASDKGEAAIRAARA